MNTRLRFALRCIAVASLASISALDLSGCGTASGAVVGGVAGAATIGSAPAVVGGAIVGGVVGHEIHKDRTGQQP